MKNNILPVNDLLPQLQKSYRLKDPVSITPLDEQTLSYLLCTRDQDFHVRLTDRNNPSRPMDHILFELEWLDYLRSHHCYITHPIQNHDNEWLTQLRILGSDYDCALFTVAKGQSSELNAKQAFLLGQEIAQIHLTSNQFHTQRTLLPLDIDTLLHKPVRQLCDFLSDTSHCQRLLTLAKQLKDRFDQMTFSNDAFGIIGGNFQGNHQRFHDGQITLFNFEACTMGFRAYDLAVFRWNQISRDSTHGFNAFYNGRLALWRALLAGYTTLRPLSSVEKSSIPLFVQLRQLWWMSTQCECYAANAPFWAIQCQRLFKKFQ